MHAGRGRDQPPQRRGQRLLRARGGHAYYNAVAFDPSPAAGAPSATPGYYALLLFGEFAQGTRGLRPLAVAGAAQLDAWQVDAGILQRRVFLINRSAAPQTIAIVAPERSVFKTDRMTPFDPTGAGRTLDAPQVRIDGRSVSANGRWPGFAPASARVAGGAVRVALAPAEAAVVTLRIR